ncbi:MAG: hypothetical protein HFE75_05585 [Firmicutes bacterium]|nr:hypothetical protein [Bacillota bacterium]
MKKITRICLCVLAIAAVMLSGTQMPAWAAENEPQAGASGRASETGVTVTTREEFMTALAQKKSPITVNNLIVIGQDAESSGRMLPVMIPANTVIQGTAGSQINCRSPIQLEGDGVCFQNIKLTFESSDALGSVPHREIFLAGHSLTLDNVKTYLDGSGNLGGFGGTEKELLPTVYAGGYPNTAIGGNASLTVRNSNDETMFQGIYMGHDAGNDSKVPYTGNAVLNLDAKAIVREEVDTSWNSQAEINITGNENGYVKAKTFYGNEDTTLTMSQVSMEGAVVERIGNLVLKDKACLYSKTEQLQNVALRNGACLDFNGVSNAVIAGDFTGEGDLTKERGILVLKQDGTLTILGTVTGTTQFQTYHRLFPGTLLANRSYIFAKAGNGPGPNFVLAPKNIENGFDLRYESGEWKVVHGETADPQGIGDIVIHSAPEKVDLRKIAETEDGAIPDENTYFEVTWYQKNGAAFSNDEVEENLFYEMDYVICIRTDDWQSDAADILDQTDWYQPVSFLTSEAHPGKYYLRAHGKGKPGDYTFLFCSDYFAELTTVADVKALKDTVLAERRVVFYDQDIGDVPPKPDLPEGPETPEGPEHQHAYEAVVTKNPTCAETGVKTFTCGCGSSYTEKIPVSTHQYIEKRVPATMEREGKIQQVCGICSYAKDIAAIESPQKIMWSKSDYTYDGKTKTPSVIVKDSKGRILSKGEDYQIRYPKDRKNPGVYTMVLEFRRDYSGRVTEEFTIRPKKTSLKRVTARSKGLQVMWKKQTVQVDGYQIQYSTSKSFKGKGTKTMTEKKNVAAKKISKLKGKKKYYVRIRTYKAVKVDGKKKTLYSDWSGKKAMRTKR